MSTNQLLREWCTSTALSPFLARRLVHKAIAKRDAGMLEDLLTAQVSTPWAEVALRGEEAIATKSGWATAVAARRGIRKGPHMQEAFAALELSELLDAVDHFEKAVWVSTRRPFWKAADPAQRIALLSGVGYDVPHTWVTWLKHRRSKGELSRGEVWEVASTAPEAALKLLEKLPDDSELAFWVFLDLEGSSSAREIRGSLKRHVIKVATEGLASGFADEDQLALLEDTILELVRSRKTYEASSALDPALQRVIDELVSSVGEDSNLAGLASVRPPGGGPGSGGPEQEAADRLDEAVKVLTSALTTYAPLPQGAADVLTGAALTPAHGAQLLTAVSARRSKGLKAEEVRADVLARGQDWLGEVSDLLWKTRVERRGNLDGLRALGELLAELDDRDARVRGWATSSQDLDALLGFAREYVPTDLVLGAPLNWAASRLVNEEFLVLTQERLGTDETLWDAYETIGATHTGTLGDLLEVVTDL
jgi:hypothetical protein